MSEGIALPHAQISFRDFTTAAEALSCHAHTGTYLLLPYNTTIVYYRWDVFKLGEGPL